MLDALPSSLLIVRIYSPSSHILSCGRYLAPEYASSGKLSDKSDVFSYGVMLLELITGHRPVDTTHMEESLVEWVSEEFLFLMTNTIFQNQMPDIKTKSLLALQARPLLTRALEERNFDALVDPRLKNDYEPNEMASMVACAAACVRHSARRRPRMSQVEFKFSFLIDLGIYLSDSLLIDLTKCSS